MWKQVAGLLLLCAAAEVQAGIYLCEDNGRKTYSQQPCGSNSKAVELEGAKGRITISDDFTAASATDLCKMMVRSWEVAAQMKRQGVAMDQANLRVFGYLREHVTNFDEATRRQPEMFNVFRAASARLTQDAYANPNILAGEQDLAVQQCATRTFEEYKRGKALKPGGGKASQTTM